MTQENINKELSEIEDEILEYLDSNIDDFLLVDRPIPIFLTLNTSIDKLCNLHIKVTVLLDYVRTLIEIEDESYEDIVFRCILMKSHIDSLVKSHPEYSHKKYPRNFEYQLDLIKGTNCIPLVTKHIPFTNNHKFISSLYKLTIEKKKIEPSKSQRRSFVSIFYPFKTKEKLKWNGSLYSLRRFFDVLEELKIIHKPYRFKEIISDNCLIKHKSGKYLSFKSDSYKTSKNKSGYNKHFDEWDEVKSLS